MNCVGIYDQPTPILFFYVFVLSVCIKWPLFTLVFVFFERVSFRI